MRVLLIGGTGAMGVSLKNVLAERGDEVYITSRSDHNDDRNIHYIKGNAHDDEFMDQILKVRYDAIVDFMIYSSEEFKKVVHKLLDSTDQYIFTSSSRVYADSHKIMITEKSPRLLDVCKDKEYLRTDEYALAKAREENILFECDQKNWTVIRPYITYNIERIQLGGLEKDIWLRRAMEGRSIPLPKDVASCYTTLTYGGDVAAAIAALIDNEKAFGEVFNITSAEHMTWFDVAQIYLDLIKNLSNVVPEVHMFENSREVYEAIGNKYQIIYDRMYHRIFDNTKLQMACDGKLKFCPLKEGLTKCLNEFLKKPRWKEGAPRLEAYLNKTFNEGLHVDCFTNKKSIIKYLGWYYMPNIMNVMREIKR